MKKLTTVLEDGLLLRWSDPVLRGRQKQLPISWAIVVAVGMAAMLPPLVRAAELNPSSGVTVEQISFRGGANSSVGEITVNRALVNSATGFTSGFINVADISGNWLVRNLPVFDSLISDAGSMSTKFNIPGISNGTPLSSLNLRVDYSQTPSQLFAGGPTLSYSVVPVANAVGGIPAQPVSGYRAGPDYSTLAFTAGPFSLTYQNGHPNVQAATNQCAPAAVANSLTYLKNSQGLPVPNPNNPGLKGDNTLVGTLDTAMNRNVTDRTHGSGVWPLDGKLSYLNNTGLDTMLIVKHVGDGGDGAGGILNGAANYTAHGVTSLGQGAAVTWAWIQNELAHGEDVELEFQFASGGAHYVEVTGAGTILGVPFITHKSDQAQTDMDPNDTNGTDSVQFDFMLGNFLTSENAFALQAISQSVPEPETYAMLLAGLGLLALVVRRRKQKAA